MAMADKFEADELGDGDAEDAMGLTFAGDSMRPAEEGSSTAEQDRRVARPPAERRIERYGIGFLQILMENCTPERRKPA
jgi:hypothetical protein